MDKTIRGLVLREVKYKEADRILTVLTAEGKMTVKAPGALRKNSKCAAATQQMTYAELTLYARVGHWQVREGVVLEGFEGLRTDLEKLSLAVYFAQVLEAVADEDASGPELLQLGLNSLYALSNDLQEHNVIKAIFELRLSCLAGYTPDLSGCMQCGDDSAMLYFDMQQGGTVCGKCRSYGLKPVSDACLAAMRHGAYAPAKRIYSFTLTGDGAEELEQLCEGYLLTMLDRRFSSLDYYKSIRNI